MLPIRSEGISAFGLQQGDQVRRRADDLAIAIGDQEFVLEIQFEPVAVPLLYPIEPAGATGEPADGPSVDIRQAAVEKK